MTDHGLDHSAGRWRYLLLATSRAFGQGLLLPILVLLLIERGLSISQVGIVMAVRAATTVALELPTGGLADTLGRRRLLAVALSLHAAGLVIVALSSSFAVFIGAAYVLGTARALFSGPLESWYVDFAQSVGSGDRVDATLGRSATLEQFGLAAGSLVGGAAGFLAGSSMSELMSPLAIGVWCAAGLAIVESVGVLVLLTDDPPREGDEPASAVRGTLKAMRRGLALGLTERRLRNLLAVEALWGLAIVAVEFLWQPRLAELRPEVVENPLQLGLVPALGFLVSGVGAAAATRLNSSLRRPELLAALFKVFQGLMLAVLALVGDVVTFFVVYSFLYLGNGAVVPLHQALLHRRISRSERVTVLSIHSLLAQGGGIAGLLLLVSAVGQSSIAAAWLVAASVFAASAVLYHPGHERLGRTNAARPLGRRAAA